jgi:hypothetical protein
MRPSRRRWLSGAHARRLVVLVVAVAGMLGLLATSAYAGVQLQHCEPLRRG